MSTRTTSAIRSRKARESLIRLLFQRQDNFDDTGKLGSAATSSMSQHQPHRHCQRRSQDSDGAIPTGANIDDQRRHSYSQLRAAYLEKVHAMHPDKISASHKDALSSKDSHMQFIELKNAWEEYHASVRMAQRRYDDSSSERNKNNSQNNEWEEEENFTMFGVGCSFADSPEERDLRFEITDQACRGWFPSGTISYPESDSQKFNSNPSLKQHIIRDMELSDNNMFVLAEQPMTKEGNSYRKHLVQNVHQFKRNR